MNKRRKFLKLASASAIAMMFPVTSLYASRTISRKKLIVLTLEGGCDTLNMFIPNQDKAEINKYIQLRGKNSKSNIAILKDTLALRGSIYSLHPKLTVLQKMWHDNKVALFPGTHSGDSSNTSHFYQFNFFDRGAYGDAGISGDDSGWLARYLNNQGKTDVDSKLYAYNFASDRNMFKNAATSVFGGNRPYNMNIGITNKTIKHIKENYVKTRDGEMAHIVNTQKIIFARVNKIKKLGLTGTSNTNFKSLPVIARDMTNAIEMLRGVEEMDLVQLSMGGFDTHTGEQVRHDRLFDTLNKALSVFKTTLSNEEMKHTLLVVQTEFSRTLDSNGTQGTDHGKAAMWFAIGGSVKKGLYGRNAKSCLTDTNDIYKSTAGRYYLKEKNDYRDILATALKWIGADNPATAFDIGKNAYTFKNKGYLL